MASASPDDLLFTDLSGERVQLQDVIYDGLDVDYSARYPALQQLLRTGRADHRLYAAAMLASWGVEEAFRAVIVWTRNPDEAPWVGAPVTFDRISGADSAFELLASAIRISGELDARSPDVDRLRDDATRALLAIYHLVSFGRALYAALDLDRALAQRLASDIGNAVDATIAAANSMTEAGFDLATQAAWLIAVLGPLDDAHAARAAEALLADHGDNPRTVRELAHALGFASGPATRELLERLAGSPNASVQADAREALGRRKDA